jgi:hypothetical protein
MCTNMNYDGSLRVLHWDWSLNMVICIDFGTLNYNLGLNVAKASLVCKDCTLKHE